MLSTQPEQVPTLAYDLPKVTRFATPLGVVPDPRVMDWRNALAKFEHSRASRVLAPLVGQMTDGTRILLVNPTDYQKAPIWMALIHHDVRSWPSTSSTTARFAGSRSPPPANTAPISACRAPVHRALTASGSSGTTDG